MADISFMTNKEYKELIETKYRLQGFAAEFVKTFIDPQSYNFGPFESVFIVGDSITLTHQQKPLAAIDFCVLDRPHLTKLRESVSQNRDYMHMFHKSGVRKNVYVQKDWIEKNKTPLRIFLCNGIQSRRELVDSYLQYDTQKIHYDISARLLYFTRQQYETILKQPKVMETA